jgi:serine/threonine-protein kinase
MGITLTVLAGPGKGRTFTFDGHDTFVVGRSPDAHFVLPDRDPFISRNHFIVETNPPLCRLVDLDSHNGTLVNGTRVRVADLRDRDLIQLGNTVLGVALSEAAVGEAEVASVTATAQLCEGEEAGQAAATPTSGLPDVPGYTVLRELGRGSMGIIYLAQTAADTSLVALKTIMPAVRPKPSALGRFLREARILKQLDHPNIVCCQDAGEANGLLYLAMEYIDGIDGAQILRREGPLSVERAVRLGGEMLEGLAHAHARGVVHRDVKPANLMVTTVNGQEVVKLTDFGLARVYQESSLSGLTLVGGVGGTPPFLAPEQILAFRETKPCSDQYAAAATLYNLLCGQHIHPVSGTPQEMFKRILQEEPTPLWTRRADLPPRLVEVIHRALARRPEDRYADVTAFWQALQRFAAHNS